MTTTTQQKLEEALDIYGIVRNGKKPSIGIANIESDDLFNDLLALIAEEVRKAYQQGYDDCNLPEIAAKITAWSDKRVVAELERWSTAYKQTTGIDSDPFTLAIDETIEELDKK